MLCKPPRFVTALVFVLACAALAAAAGCVGAGNSRPLVAYGSLSGDGDVRTDSNVFLAIGEFTGDAGIFAKGSGFPLTFPLNTKKNEWIATNKELDTTLQGKLGTHKLPEWCGPLFRPGELEALSTRLGVTIEVEPPIADL